MMSRRLLIGVVSAACMLLLMAGMPGCSKQQAPEKKPQESQQQSKSQVPESFTKMVADTEMLIVDLSSKTKNVQIQGMEDQAGQNGAANQNTQGQTGASQGQQNQTGQSGQQQQQGQQNQTGQPGQQQQQGQQNQAGQQQGQQNQAEQQQQQKQGQPQQSGQQSQTTQTGQGQNTAQQKNQDQAQSNTAQSSNTGWDQTQKTLKDLHQNWNSLEPDVARAGLSMEARDGFEKALEDLTRNVAAQNSQTSLIGAIDMYKAFSDMANVLKTELPPSYYRLKYELMAATAQAGLGQWEAAKNHAAGFKQQNEMLKVKEEESTTQVFAQLDHALNDLYRAVEIKERDLVMIKSEIAMKNLEQLKKKLTEQSQQKSGSNGTQ